MESVKSEAARAQPDVEAQTKQADAQRNMTKAVSALTNLPAGVQAEAEAEAARQALYDYMKADEGGKAAAQSKAAEQLKKSISRALEAEGLDKWTRQRLEGILDNIDSKGEMGDNKSKQAVKKPYMKGRPSLRKGVDLKTWENAKGDDGLVRDPHTKEVIHWEPGQPRKGVWDMGHIKGQKYSDMYKKYIKGMMTVKEFVDWYNDYRNYLPELPGPNRGHRYE